MLKDEKYFETLRTGEAPRLPSSLATFVGQTLGNHYEDTVRAPLPDEMKRQLDALDGHDDDSRRDDQPAATDD
ncbi:MAG: hypothetical protein ABWY78_22645 [Microvirga sp.]